VAWHDLNDGGGLCANAMEYWLDLTVDGCLSANARVLAWLAMLEFE
jgi:hypothetical protein